MAFDLGLALDFFFFGLPLLLGLALDFLFCAFLLWGLDFLFDGVLDLDFLLDGVLDLDFLLDGVLVLLLDLDLLLDGVLDLDGVLVMAGVLGGVQA